MEPLKISWEEYTHALDHVIKQVKGRQFQDKAILAISRGGLIPGVALSHVSYNTAFDVIRCIGYAGKLQLPEVILYPPLDYTFGKAPLDVLVVDDLIDTGRTLSAVSDWLKSSGFVRTPLSPLREFTRTRRFSIAVVYDKVRVDREIAADIVGVTLPADRWVTFPYEQLDSNC